MTSKLLSQSTTNPATEKVDDWEPDKEQPLLLKMPSFVRLFVMRRMLQNYSGTTDALINDSNIDKSMRDTAKDIVSSLRNSSIKAYMKQHYNEKKQAEVIETIFNQIILRTFPTEYQNVSQYKASAIFKKEKNEDESKHNDDDNDCTNYENLLFNTTDIMCLIFQFLTDFDRFGQYIGELSNCSLVCSQWLYHVFNPNSYYYLHLLRITSATARSDGNVDRNVTRAWQRLWKVKKVRFDLDDVDETCLNQAPNILFNKLSMLRNIEIIEFAAGLGEIAANQLAALKLILQNCKEKIRLYSLQLGLRDQDVLSPLVLNNAQEILTDHTYFSIIWSKKLEKLDLPWFRNINDKWCNVVINKCDCSGIKQLSLHNLTFDNSTMNKNSHKTQLLLTKLAKKFTNVKIFYVSFYEKVDDCVLLLWKSLDNHMSINNSNINMNTELSLPSKLEKEEYSKLIKMIKENNPKISQIEMEVDNRWSTQKVWMNKIISKCTHTLEFITIDDLAGEQNDFESLIDELKLNLTNDQSKLKIICMRDWHGKHRDRLNDIKKLLEWEMIVKRGLVMLVYVNIRIKKALDIFKSEFEALCDRVLALMEKQLAFNLCVRFVDISRDRSGYIHQYVIDFEKNKLFTDYKIPKCNEDAQKYVEVLSKPILSFTTEDQYQDNEYDGGTTCTFEAANIRARGHIL